MQVRHIVPRTTKLVVFQPAVTLAFHLEEDEVRPKETLNLMLDLTSFEKLRFYVAKALNATQSYKIKN